VLKILRHFDLWIIAARRAFSLNVIDYEATQISYGKGDYWRLTKEVWVLEAGRSCIVIYLSIRYYFLGKFSAPYEWQSRVLTDVVPSRKLSLFWEDWNIKSSEISFGLWEAGFCHSQHSQTTVSRSSHLHPRNHCSHSLLLWTAILSATFRYYYSEIGFHHPTVASAGQPNEPPQSLYMAPIIEAAVTRIDECRDLGSLPRGCVTYQ
jgi:hypothetical protein